MNPFEKQQSIACRWTIGKNWLFLLFRIIDDHEEVGGQKRTPNYKWVLRSAYQSSSASGSCSTGATNQLLNSRVRFNLAEIQRAYRNCCQAACFMQSNLCSDPNHHVHMPANSLDRTNNWLFDDFAKSLKAPLAAGPEGTGSCILSHSWFWRSPEWPSFEPFTNLSLLGCLKGFA